MSLHRTSLAFVFTFAIAGVLHAQNAGGAVPSPPSNSFNWLNLQRQGNSAAANYYQLVRPQFQTQNALQNIQQEYNNLAQNSAWSSKDNNDQNAPIRDTGHSATFMNYGRYYPRMTGGGGGGGGGRPSGRR